MARHLTVSEVFKAQDEFRAKHFPAPVSPERAPRPEDYEDKYRRLTEELRQLTFREADSARREQNAELLFKEINAKIKAKLVLVNKYKASEIPELQKISAELASEVSSLQQDLADATRHHQCMIKLHGSCIKALQAFDMGSFNELKSTVKEIELAYKKD
jgi:predicted RNase H-like nuclease (RuvC/YqgF family)